MSAPVTSCVVHSSEVGFGGQWQTHNGQLAEMAQRRGRRFTSPLGPSEWGGTRLAGTPSGRADPPVTIEILHPVHDVGAARQGDLWYQTHASAAIVRAPCEVQVKDAV